jgi:hypothetical protein
MSGKQARVAKQAKMMARIYCFPDGSQPGPYPTHEFVLRAVYREFRKTVQDLVTPLLAALKQIKEREGLV